MRALPALVVCAIAFALGPERVEAQETRAATLERQRAEKAAGLKPYEPTRLEKLVMHAEDGRLRRLIFPHNGFFAEYGYTDKPTGSGIGFGGGFRHDLLGRRARIVLEAGATFRKYQLLRADFSLPRLARERLELGIEATYRHHPQEDFYGSGPNTLEEDRVSFLFEGTDVQGRAILRPERWLRIGARVGQLAASVGAGTDSRFPSIEARFGEDVAPGLLEQPDYLYGEGFVEIDYRDEPGNARAGGRYVAAWRQHADRDLDRHSFRSLDVLLQQFVPVFDKKRVFAFQAGFIGATAEDGHRVPFYMRPTVGGSRTIRSVADYRFRDTHVMWLNAEYRWEVFGALDMALFTDVGKAAPRAGELDLSDMKKAYGIGFRFNTASTVFYRIDIATGAGEGIQYFFKFSKAF